MAREDLHFRLRISESLKKRIQASGEINGRSMTAEIVARLEASFLVEDIGEMVDNPADAEMLAILDDIDNLKRRFVQTYKRRK